MLSMVDAWGGEAGIEWAQNKLESIREKMSYDTTLAKLCVYTTTWETITSL